MINESISKLISYGLLKELFEKEDKIYVINQLLELLNISEYEEVKVLDTKEDINLEEVLNEILDYAYENGIMKENTILYRDLFDTKVMNILIKKPSEIIKTFWDKYKVSAEEATKYYYNLSQDTDYIRRYRISKDLKWITKTKYGDLDITINLSKPEKDPAAIKAAKSAKQSGYPKCLLCKENEGYAGGLNHPARQNHRIIPITINESQWGFQYSPYVYYNEHCIVFNGEHTPMKIEKETFRKLFDFVKLFPHYFVGSNADLPIVGGSILSHDHFQGGNYKFAMEKAEVEREFIVEGYEDVKVGIVKWPMSVIRIASKDDKILVELGDKILSKWRNYTDEDVFIYAESDSEAHNTITPIARKNEDMYELDLVLRNNITTKEYPFGMFHPHEELHHIKKENIGLIEVMGLAVLPSRLKNEMEELKKAILNNNDIKNNELLSKHNDWVNSLMVKYNNINKDTIDDIIEKEIGLVFLKVLEHSGVYKRDEKGQMAFDKFINTL